MTTLNVAVQAIINRLGSGVAGAMSAEDVVLLSKSIEALIDNADWEAALIAVAEQHLNTATGSVQSARDALTAAINAVVAAKNDLSANTNQLAKIETVLTNLRKMQRRFCFYSHRGGDSLIYNTTSTGTRYGANICLSIDDFDTGEYWGAFVQPQQSSINELYMVHISAAGLVTATSFNQDFLADSGNTRWQYVPFPDGKCRIIEFNGNAAALNVRVQNATPASWNTWTYSYNGNSSHLVYLDPIARKLYCLSPTATLVELTASAAVPVVPTVTFATAAEFTTYATGLGWVELYRNGNSGAFGAVKHGWSGSYTSGSSSINSGSVSVTSWNGVGSNQNANSWLTFKSTETSQMRRAVIPTTSVVHISQRVGNTDQGISELFVPVPWSSRYYGTLPLEVYSRYAYLPASGYSGSYYPWELLGYSEIHNALVASGAATEYYSSNTFNWLAVAVSFGSVA